jgi:hypothetical protein
MPPMARGAFSKTIVPGYRKILFETYKERPAEGNVLVNMGTSKRAYEEDFPIAGFGTLLVKTEGGAVPYQDAIEGLVKRYAWTTYALGFKITQEMYEDDLYGIFGNKMSKALGRSARNNFEIVAHAPLNNAFSTSFVGFETAKSLCSLTHTTLRGQTIANRPTTDTDITLISLQAAVEHFDSLVDEAGLPMLRIPRRLVYNPGDRWIVAQLLKSEKLPGGNMNDVNELRNQGLQPHLSHYLTDSDAWYILADEHDVNYFDRRQPVFSNTDDFETGDAKFKLTRRNGSGFGDWRGVYGSPGA